jgi:hypothetical protein
VSDVRGSFLAADDPAWTEALRAATHDVYHFPGYARLCGRLEGGEARAFVASDGPSTFFVPLIVRNVPGRLCNGQDLRDATVPYGYPGPLLAYGDGVDDADQRLFLHGAVRALMACLREHRIVSVFARLHPLLPVDPAVLGQFGSVVPSGETVAIDLSRPEETLWRQMRSNHRRDISKAIGRGEVAERDATWAGLGAFVQAYRETMIRNGANPYYLFTDEYYETLREALGDHLHLWTVRAGSDIIAGALLTECNGIVQYHLGGTADRFLTGNPLKLLFHRAMAWFKMRGNRWLHLGGGVGGASDSLLHFKRGFSPDTFPFYTWRLVLDVDTYDELLARAGGTGAPDAQPPRFFPAYRELARPAV